MFSKWLPVMLLFPSLLFASEDCVSQLKGKCKDICAPNEIAEQGAFIDCGKDQQCCLPLPSAKALEETSSVVLIEGYAFAPAVVKVRTGTEVIWKNKDDDQHTVTADDGSFNSRSIGARAEFRQKFTKAGTYKYYCDMHPYMAGTIVVE